MRQTCGGVDGHAGTQVAVDVRRLGVPETAEPQ